MRGVRLGAQRSRHGPPSETLPYTRFSGGVLSPGQGELAYGNRQERGKGAY